ncbi:AraC family transcriptional regulator ligand-binding domain-containing protein [Nocardia terrae]|uniref:AraC family transcriptional regulator ligand-binding domain-containing protein n=1 Tax=Nocardia terrae TaxID=2675851 RepID=UPI0012FB70DE|nr:AraC family transcriptional regulator ligand-binding domain-containing protein [Nocardia terrae]
MLEATDNVLLPQSVLRHAVGAGLKPRQLAAATGLPSWSLSGAEEYRVPSTGYLRTWEVVEHGLGDPNAAIEIAKRYVLGQVGLYDYLFSTAPTLGAGLEACGTYLGAITTNFRMAPGLETEQEVTFEISMINGEGRGRELAAQWGLAAIFTRSRLIMDGPVNPVRIAFEQQAPRNHDQLVELFGTTEIDFGAPSDSITVSVADLARPLRTADARLAEILHQHAARTQPVAPPHASTWLDHLAGIISTALDENSAGIDAVAARMYLSRRSLQRRLSEHGTTWRTELERVRRARYETADASLGRSGQAVLLGYKDHRSARRAVKRWDR